MDNPAIEIDNLGVRFNQRWVVRGFCARIMRGEKVALTGPSGAGKSTVLKCVLGLAMPQEGTLRVLGQRLDAGSVWQVRHSLAYVAQEPDLGTDTARQVIHQPFQYKANAHLRGNLHRLGELLARFNLDDGLLDQQMSALSGGEKQRIALICAILLDRPIILLDEASSALDKANRQAVANFISAARELTVLSVAHDVEWLGFSDRVIELSGAGA